MFDSSHWYKQNGSPFYVTKDAKGNDRDVTLRDARKINAVPSVTTVTGIIAKLQLVNWMVDQGILAALTMPLRPDEPEDEYIKRIKLDSRKQAIEAAEEGTRIHDAIERDFLRSGSAPKQYWPHIAATRLALAKQFPAVNDWVSEKSFAHPEGFGGKVDLHSPSTGIVVDFKGKDGDFTDGKKLAYDRHWQLGAYQYGLGLQNNVGANVFVSRTHPGEVSLHVWTQDEMVEGRDIFLAALALWKRMKKYSPERGAK